MQFFHHFYWLAEGASRHKRCPGIKAEPPPPPGCCPPEGGALPQRDTPGTQGGGSISISDKKHHGPPRYLAGPAGKYWNGKYRPAPPRTAAEE